MDKFEFLVLTIRKKQYNTTVSWLERIDVPYHVLIPDTCDPDIAPTYGDSAIVYSRDEMAKYVDFCGTNITNGAAVGRTAATKWVHDNNCIGIVFDDDYDGLSCMMYSYLNKNQLYGTVKDIYELHKQTGLELGGYSGGSMPRLTRNVMQIFFIDNDTPIDKFRYILNEDVAASIEDWQRGIGTFGLGPAIRSSGQAAEMEKWDGNTAAIYHEDLSYRKSYGAVLASPNNVKLVQNLHNRRLLWHHKVSWKNITPMIIEE